MSVHHARKHAPSGYRPIRDLLTYRPRNVPPPYGLRLRKRILDQNARKRAEQSRASTPLVHTLVCLAAYRFLTETKVLSAEQLPDIETTTAEQRARGESSFELMREVKTISKAVPTPVVCYMWAGYAGLAASVIYSMYFRIRYGTQ